MIVLDASVLIAHLSPLDPHVADAVPVFDAVDERLVLHALTLAEVLVGGVRVGRAADLRAVIEGIGVQLAPHDDDEPLRLAELRVATGLRVPDCCTLDTAIVHRARLATFDGRLADAARRLGVRTLP